jgi:transposase-like protein
MTNTTLPPLRPELVVCPNPLCGASGRIGIHSHTKRRYKCHACGKTFAETIGTPLYGLKSPLWVVRIVLILLAFGCPVPAIVAAFGVDERTVTAWHQKAGRHAKVIQDQMVCQGQVEVGQVQGDELYVKTQHGTVWMATAMSVFSRLFLWGAVAPHRDTRLITQVVQQVRAAAQRGRPILWAVDGFAAWTTAILTVFREPLHTGKRGRPRLVGWPDLHIVQVIKRRTGRRLTAVERRLAHGCRRCAEAIMQATQVGLAVINTAYIERLNATFRTWLPALTRRTRTPARQVAHLEAAMFWLGAVYNFCRVHTTLNATPAMAADLTDHVWSVDELLRYRPKRE